MFHATTVLAVRHNGQTAWRATGRSPSATRRSSSARGRFADVARAHRAGFAGPPPTRSPLSRFRQNSSSIAATWSSAVEPPDWRTDRILRRLEAMLIVSGTASRRICCPATATSLSPTTDHRGIDRAGQALAAAKALAAHGARRARHRGTGHAHSRRDLYLFERQPDHRSSVNRTPCPSIFPKRPPPRFSR